MSQQSAFYSIVWACLSSWYYGFHLSELNFPAASLTCLSPAIPPPSRLPLCLGLDTTLYGVVTAAFTVGGLVGSLGSSWVVQREGVRGGIALTGWLNVLGVVCMALAPYWVVLALGRFIAGLSAGVAVCLVPPFLSLIARTSPTLSNRSGQVGTLHQMGIVIGLFSAQAAGLILTGKTGDIPGSWRNVVAISGVISLLQIVAGRFIDGLEHEEKDADVESIAEISGRVESGLAVAPVDDSEASPLLGPVDPSNSSQLPLRELLSNTSLRTPTLLCAAILTLQQLSGVNAVMFYSTPVLRPLMPASAATIGLQITAVNALMTVVAIFLVDRMERRSLLLVSVTGMTLTSALLAWGLDNGHNLLSASVIVLFIVFFAVGLGPIPFLLVSELVPQPAIPALASLSLSLAWISNFFIALLFLPLRDALSEPVDPHDPIGDRKGEGRVFYVFTAVCVVLGLLISRGLRGSREQ
ncbi:general substrate transporter [Naematelia encephala]|uniref:General substrate transporter n=1 Tax=Naematelia encephala TaxID=71784 RepID=A0A1Y2BBC5_9TREE|nr:general substrate transporter [Naematelia encephala]